MSDLEHKLHEAFDAVRLPEEVAKSTLAYIETKRAEGQAAERAAEETCVPKPPTAEQEPAVLASRFDAAAESGIRATARKAACARSTEAADGAETNAAHDIGTKAADDGAVETVAQAERDLTVAEQEAGDAAFVPRVIKGGKKRRPLFARKSFRFAVAACLCGALAFGGGSVVYASESAYVEISADGLASAASGEAGAPQGAELAAPAKESSVELGINCFNIVVRATGLNEEGEALLQRVDVVGKSYEEVANLLMGQDATGLDGFVDVTVTSSNENQRGYLSSASETCLGHRAEGTYACDHATDEERQAAQESGMGTARYQAYLELAALDPTVTVEECQDLPMHELRWMIEALENGDAATAAEAREQAEAAGHHGQNAGNGHGAGGAYGSGNGQGTNGAQGNGAGQGAGGSANVSSGAGNGAGAGSGGGAGQGGAGHGAGSGSGGGHGAGHGRGAE